MQLKNFEDALRSGRLRLVEQDASALLRLSIRPTGEPYFGKKKAARWDDPNGQYGVTYAAQTLSVAFAETILHDQGLFQDGAWLVPEEKVNQRSIVYLTCHRPLRLADLTGPALKAMGLDNQISAGSDYSQTGLMSRALFDAVPECDGIKYLSRQNNTAEAVAIFDRSGVEIHPARTRFLQSHQDLPTLLMQFGVELLPSGDEPGMERVPKLPAGLKRIR